MKFYKVDENVVHNLLLFLDRVEIKGLKEIQAMNQILDSFNNPIEENSNEQETK